MKFHKTSIQVRDTLAEIFQAMDRWFDLDQVERSYQPNSGRWTIDQVLEHVMLTNHFLMLTLEKQVRKAEKRARQNPEIVDTESDLSLLEVIGERRSFGWERPEHMEPTGENSSVVRARLKEQLESCQSLLDRIADGVGSLVLTTMTVNNLGKIDLYQWLYFIAQHARRHLDQLQEIHAEMNGS